MAIVSFDKDTVIEYIPEYGGNRESESPCVVRLRFVPYSKVRHYARLLQARTHGLTDPERVFQVAQEVQKKEFVESVESISGFYVGEREVREPEEFYEVAPARFVYEILEAVEDQQKLIEGQRKN